MNRKSMSTGHLIHTGESDGTFNNNDDLHNLQLIRTTLDLIKRECNAPEGGGGGGADTKNWCWQQAQ
jgi:hypothetical protein